MHKINALPMLSALVLVACGGEPEQGAGADTVGEAVEQAEAVMPAPGKYTTTTELLDLEVPGAPAAVVDMMRTAFAEGATQGSSYCLTEADAAAAREQTLENMVESDCTVSSFDQSGGTINGVMQCKGQGGASGTVELNGTMNEAGSDMVMSFDQQLPGGAGAASIRMRVVSERTGDCA